MTERDVIDRDEAIRRIRAGLRARTGKDWSVTGGQGSVWGWITVGAPPRRRVDAAGNPSASGSMTAADLAELAAVLGLPSVHHQGLVIPAGHDYRVEYVDRAEGRAPSVIGHPYWD